MKTEMNRTQTALTGKLARNRKSTNRRRTPVLSSKEPAVKLTQGTKETIFRLAASVARNVLLAGEFTGWNKAPLKMMKSPDGIWNLKVNLAPGRYRYQFLIDVDAQNDPAEVRKAPLPFGTLHGEVEVRI